MGFLTNIFKSKQVIYLELLVKELKEDKNRLIIEIDKINDSKAILEQKIEFLTHRTSKTKIIDDKPTKKEKKMIELIQSLGLKNKKQICERLQLKESSFNIYLYNIKRKGFVFEEKEE